MGDTYPIWGKLDPRAGRLILRARRVQWRKTALSGPSRTLKESARTIRGIPHGSLKREPLYGARRRRARAKESIGTKIAFAHDERALSTPTSEARRLRPLVAHEADTGHARAVKPLCK